jgi:phage-related protein
MKESIHFYYDGKFSKDMGVIQASVDSGLFEEQFLSNKSIRETRVKGNSKPYFQGIERDPLEFPLSMVFEHGFDDNKIRETTRWINQDYYKPFYSEENPSRILYAQYVGDPRIIHNGIKEGYVTLQMRCNDAFSYSPAYISPEYDFTINTVSGTELTFVNYGDTIVKPIMEITKVGIGDVSIINHSNGGEIFEIKNLNDGEIVQIDNEREHVESDIPGVYRYDDITNDNYLTMVYGTNRLTVYGKCKIQFKCQFKILYL